MLNERTTEQLIYSENQFRAAFEFSAIGMAITNVDGKLIEVNNSLCKMIGYSAAALLLHTFQDITHPEDLETDLHLFQQLTAGLIPSYQMEKRYIHSDGHTIWALLAMSVVRDEDGNILQVIKQIQDISDLKYKDQQLLQSENQFRSAFEFSAIGMALANLGGKLIKVNSSLCKMIGYGEDELLMHTFQDITHPNDLENDLHLFKDLIKGTIPSYQMVKRYIHKNGQVVWALLAVSVVRDQYGNILHFIKQIQDISELKENETKLKTLNQKINEANGQLFNKNKELLQFAHVASHDLQEPLRMVTGFLSSIKKKYDALLDEEGKKFIYYAIDGANRMRQLITDILDYSSLDGPDKFDLSAIDLNGLVKYVLEINKTAIEERHAVIEVENLPVIMASKLAMQQLFGNLISNAVKYQLPGKQPVIKIKVTDEKDYWLFTIEDNGIGMDEKGLDKIFNLFQRLHRREQYAGTGIGLALCKKIVNNLKGEIWATSTPGVGSVFHFTIPK
jgi:PAS domain S-box-containing protein